MAGVLLSFGNLLSEIVSAGSPALNASNPGIVKLISGFVFPAGLTMSVITFSYLSVRLVHPLCRIVLNGQELLTSNMLVFPIAVCKRAVPWWGLPYNWLVGKRNPIMVAFPGLIPFTCKCFSEILSEAFSSLRFSCTVSVCTSLQLSVVRRTTSVLT
jgi:hypothetical protein